MYSDKMVIVCLCKVCTYTFLCIVLKEQIEEMKKKEERLEKVLAETQAENKRLQEPLQRVGLLPSLTVVVTVCTYIRISVRRLCTYIYYIVLHSQCKCIHIHDWYWRYVKRTHLADCSPFSL